MKQRFCPACGHALNNADERGVAAFYQISNDSTHHSCAQIDCIDFMLVLGYKFIGIAKAPVQRNTCDGDCA